MGDAGVPDNQLLAVSGGERISLFTAAQRKKSIDNAPPPCPGPPQGPPGLPVPPLSEAVITVHARPALHALMPPGDHRDLPETMDTGVVYTGDPTMACTLDITRNLTYGLGGLIKLPQLPPQIPPQMCPFLEYLRDKDLNKYSYFDGGQIMFNSLLGSNAVLEWPFGRVSRYFRAFGTAARCCNPRYCWKSKSQWASFRWFCC